MMSVTVVRAEDPVLDNAGKMQVPEETGTITGEEKSALPKASADYKLKEGSHNMQQNPATDMGDVLLALLAVLGLIVVLAWASKRLNISGLSAGQQLKLQSVLSLGSKEKVIIVEVEGKRLLLGVTPQNVNLLCALDDEHNTSNSNTPSSADLSAGQDQQADTFAQHIKKALASGENS